MTAAKKVHIKTFGCQMNVYDSERIGEALEASGYRPTDDAADADLIVLNTCHIREKAADKVYSDIGRYRVLKEERAKSGKETLITVAGCVAQAEGAEMLRRAPAINLVIGPQSYHRLPELLTAARASSRGLVETEFPEEDKFSKLPARGGIPNSKSPSPVSAFLTVQEGCDKFCTFCVVPYTRGAEYSRAVADIESEARKLVERGTKEITLLGQNVNAYHGKGPDGTSWGLAALIRTLARVDGLERIRYMTSHPRDMSDDLIEIHGDEPKLMPFLHLPVQSGSDRILAGMNRKHTVDEYVRLVNRIRAARPDIALSTDMIVGFPGETDADFDATLDIAQRVGFVQAYTFKYSERPGTPAAGMENQVPESVKAERLQRLQGLLDAQQTAFNRSCVGKTIPVLFEKLGRSAGQLVGRSPYLQIVHVPADSSLLGRTIAVSITSAGQNSLVGAPPSG